MTTSYFASCNILYIWVHPLGFLSNSCKRLVLTWRLYILFFDLLYILRSDLKVNDNSLHYHMIQLKTNRPLPHPIHNQVCFTTVLDFLFEFIVF